MVTGGVPNGYLTVQTLAERLKVHGMTIRRWMAQKRLPAPKKFPGKPACWHESVIDKWVETYPGQIERLEMEVSPQMRELIDGLGEMLSVGPGHVWHVALGTLFGAIRDIGVKEGLLTRKAANRIYDEHLDGTHDGMYRGMAAVLRKIATEASTPNATRAIKKVMQPA